MLFKNIKRFWKETEKWKTPLRNWARFKIVVFPALFVIGLLLMLVPLYLGNVSTENLSEDVKFPEKGQEICLNFTEPTEVSLTLPYEIENSGYYDLARAKLDITLKIVYVKEKSGKKATEVIFQDSTDPTFIKVGSELKGELEAEYDEFEWDEITDYLTEADPSETDETEVLMDILFSFNDDWIFWEDVDLTEDVDEQEEDLTEGEEYETSRTYKSEISVIGTILLFAIFVVVFPTLKSRQTEPDDLLSIIYEKKKSKLREFLLKHKQIFTAVIQATLFPIIFVVWDITSLYQHQKTMENLEGVDTGDYSQRFELATYVSIVVLVLIVIASIVPVLFSKRFTPFTIKKSALSLGISVLWLISIINWTRTAIIVYKIDNATVVRNSYTEFIPFVVLSVIYIVLKVYDLTHFIAHRKKYEVLRKKYGYHQRLRKHQARKGAKKLDRERKKRLKKETKARNESVQPIQEQIEVDLDTLTKCPNCGGLSIVNEGERCPMCEH